MLLNISSVEKLWSLGLRVGWSWEKGVERWREDAKAIVMICGGEEQQQLFFNDYNNVYKATIFPHNVGLGITRQVYMHSISSHVNFFYLLVI